MSFYTFCYKKWHTECTEIQSGISRDLDARVRQMRIWGPSGEMHTLSLWRPNEAINVNCWGDRPAPRDKSTRLLPVSRYTHHVTASERAFSSPLPQLLLRYLLLLRGSARAIRARERVHNTWHVRTVQNFTAGVSRQYRCILGWIKFVKQTLAIIKDEWDFITDTPCHSLMLVGCLW